MGGIGIIGVVIVLIGIVITTILKQYFLSSGSANKYKLPLDIKNRVISKWPNENDHSIVFKMLNEIGNNRFNVGTDQLIRSILIIADDDKLKIKKIIDQNYYGDPRDVIMEAMGVEGNTNDHGTSPFEVLDTKFYIENLPDPNAGIITPRKLEIYSSYFGDIDPFVALGDESEKNEISDEEWSLIDEFVQEIIMIKKGRTSKEYEVKLNERIEKNCFDSNTVDELKEVATKIDSFYNK